MSEVHICKHLGNMKTFEKIETLINDFQGGVPTDYSEWLRKQSLENFKIIAFLVVTTHPTFHFILTRMNLGVPDSLANRVISSLVIGLLYLIARFSSWGRRYVLELLKLALIIIFCSTLLLVFESNNHPIYMTASIVVITVSSLIFFTLKDHMIVLWTSFAFFISLNYFFNTYSNFINTLSFFTPIFIISQMASIPKIRLQIQQFKTNQLLQIQKISLNESLTNLQNIKEKMIQQSQIVLLGKITAGLSHEINNPLAVSSLIINKLQSDIDSEKFDLEYLKKHIGKIKKANFRMQTIVSNMELVSNRYSNETLEDVSLVELWESILIIFGPIVSQEKIDFSYNEVPKLSIYSGQSKLTIALLNVLLNAIEFMPKVESPWIKVHFNQSGSQLFMRISNSGKIDSSNEVLIFLPFYTTKEVGEGLGLGLSASKGILESYNGKIELLSNEEFTTFLITLPISPQNNFQEN